MPFDMVKEYAIYEINWGCDFSLVSLRNGKHKDRHNKFLFQFQQWWGLKGNCVNTYILVSSFGVKSKNNSL